MSILTEDPLRPHRTISEFHQPPVLAGELIYNGAIVSRDPSTGYARNAADTAGYEVIGVASETVDNSAGLSGEQTISCFSGQIHEFTTTGADQTWYNKEVYVVDNDTVALTGVNNWVLAGTVTRYISATRVEVLIHGITDNKKNSNGATAFNLPLLSWVGATTDELTVAEVAGTFNRNLDTNALTLEGQEASSATITSAMHYHYTVPGNYQAGGAITFRARAYIKGAGTIGATKTIDLEAFKQTDGTASADICATAAQDLTAAYATYDFTITPTGVVPGDVIMFKLSTAVQETAGTEIQSDIAWTKVICPTV